MQVQLDHRKNFGHEIQTQTAKFTTFLHYAQNIAIVLTIVAHIGICRRDESPFTTDWRYCPNHSWVLPAVLVLTYLLSRHRFLVASLRKTIQRVKASRSTVSLKGISRASSRQALSRLSRVSSREFCRFSTSICKSLLSRKHRASLRAITAKECFARLDYIERLSVSDLAVIFKYAENINLKNFDKKKFLHETSQLVRAIATAMDLAVTVSRGAMSGGARLEHLHKAGDMDALYFVAASRIFSEWRSLRLVPQGFKRHAVGMKLAHRDLLQNLRKIEDAVHSYLKYCASNKRSNLDEPIPSPSVRQLIQHEIDSSVHSNLPYLNEASAGSGFLWAGRQIQYQETIFRNVLEIPSKYLNSKEAGMAAYMEVYGDYHGWAVKQVFNHSIGGSPSLDSFLKAMDPPKTPKDDEQSMPERKLSDVSENDSFPPSKDTSDENLVVITLDAFGKHVTREWDNFGKHMAGEWDKAIRFLGRFNCVEILDLHQQEKGKFPISNSSNLNLAETENSAVVDANHIQEAIEEIKPNDPNEKVKQSMAEHTKLMQPLMVAFHTMVEELNINDPTKV